MTPNPDGPAMVPEMRRAKAIAALVFGMIPLGIALWAHADGHYYAGIIFGILAGMKFGKAFQIWRPE